jgi:hypothetical protein
MVHSQKKFILLGALTRLEMQFDTLGDAITWAKDHGLHLPLEVCEVRGVVDHGGPVWQPWGIQPKP